MGPLDSRSPIAVIASATTAGLMMGLILPLLALLLERDEIGTTRIGLNAAVGSLAIVIMGPIIPRILAAVGVLRFLLGICLALYWAISEVWIISLSTAENRGRVVAFYMTALAFGIGAGPLLITVMGIDGWPPFLLSAGLVILMHSGARRLLNR